MVFRQFASIMYIIYIYAPFRCREGQVVFPERGGIFNIKIVTSKFLQNKFGAGILLVQFHHIYPIIGFSCLNNFGLKEVNIRRKCRLNIRRKIRR